MTGLDEKLLHILKKTLVLIGTTFIIGYFNVFMWEMIITDLFGLPVINIWQAIGLRIFVLSFITKTLTEKELE